MDTALVIPKEQRRWAVTCHLAAAAGLLVPWVGFGLGPLIAWVLLRQEHPTVDAHGREAINFNLSMMIWMAAGSLIGWAVGSLAWFVPIALLTLWMAAMVIAALKAAEGESYRYPITIRFLD